MIFSKISFTVKYGGVFPLLDLLLPGNKAEEVSGAEGVKK